MLIDPSLAPETANFLRMVLNGKKRNGPLEIRGNGNPTPYGFTKMAKAEAAEMAGRGRLSGSVSVGAESRGNASQSESVTDSTDAERHRRFEELVNKADPRVQKTMHGVADKPGMFAAKFKTRCTVY